MRDENARLREALQSLCDCFWGDDDVVLGYQVGEPQKGLRAARAVLGEENNDAKPGQ